MYPPKRSQVLRYLRFAIKKKHVIPKTESGTLVFGVSIAKKPILKGNMYEPCAINPKPTHRASQSFKTRLSVSRHRSDLQRAPVQLPAADSRVCLFSRPLSGFPIAIRYRQYFRVFLFHSQASWALYCDIIRQARNPKSENPGPCLN